MSGTSGGSLANGNCGRCGAPIEFLQVMLCSACLHAALQTKPGVAFGRERANR
jgi:hypothetical protein